MLITRNLRFVGLLSISAVRSRTPTTSTTTSTSIARRQPPPPPIMASFFASLGRQQEPTEEDASTSTAASKDEDVKLPITGTRKDSTESLAKSYWSDDEADHSAANNNKPPMPDWLVEMVSKTVADVKLGLDKANEQFREMTTNSSKKPETVEGEATTEGGSKEEVNQVGPTLEATKTPTLTSRATTSSWQQQFEEARKKFLMDASIALMPPIVQKGLQLTKDTTYFPELEKDAQVRRGNELCSGEKEFREKRLLKVKKAIEDFIGEKIDHLDDVPVIAIGGSGGGCRAMTSSAGAFSKFKELGIMDMTTYLGGVSGTTWAMAACTANEFDFDRLRVRMGYVLSQNMMSFGMWMVRAWHEVLVSQPLVEKFGIPEDTLSLVDLWSSLIAGSLFGENEAIRKVVASKPQATEKPKEGSLAETVANTASLGNPADPDDPWMGKLALRKLSMQVQDGSQPMPIYQVVRDVILPVDKATLEQQKQKVVTEASANSPALLPTQVIKWLPYEFTPFEMGTTLQGGYYIPTWSFGRRFQNGTDLDKRPEVSFATILGVCSSAFTANVQAVFENFEESLPVGVKKQLESVLAEKGSMHVVEPARFCNPFWENREGEDVSLASGGGDVEGKVEEEVKKEEENKKEEAKKEEDEITGAKVGWFRLGASHGAG